MSLDTQNSKPITQFTGKQDKRKLSRKAESESETDTEGEVKPFKARAEKEEREGETTRKE